MATNHRDDTYVSEALNSIEHLALIVSRQLQAEALLQYFGSLPVLAHPVGPQEHRLWHKRHPSLPLTLRLAAVAV